jgi:hypothetical protein
MKATEHPLFLTALNRAYRRLAMKRTRTAVQIGAMVRLCPGGNHAWYDSNVGMIRKPIQRQR